MKKNILKLIGTNPNNWATLPLRLAAGLVFIAHGSQKLFGAFGGFGLQGTAGFFESQLGMKPGILWASLAGCGEFFGGLALLFGLVTRFFGIVTAIVMSTAIISVHFGIFFAEKGGMEYPLTLLLISISLVISGGGALSIDSLITGKPNKK